MTIGKVYLVGAGPGDPGLITVRGMELLKSADVILYDKLANPELLAVSKPGAEKIFVGKEAGVHHVKQEDTIQLMIDKAFQGKNVVRLKGGDPLIFGRGSEEALALVEKGIEFEFVPGITAATGATAYAGLPVTHRNIVTQCLMLTAHEAPDKPESQVEWGKIAKLKNTTIVIYMGAKLLPKIVDTLIRNGMAPDMPAAIIRNGTLPNQETYSSVLSKLPGLLKTKNLKPPLITVISPTAEMMGPLDWFSKRPLHGKRIVITRAADQSDSLRKMLIDEGAYPVMLPVIRTVQAYPEIPIIDILDRKYDWIVFSSENGVRWFFSLLDENGLDSRVLAGMKIAAIGSGTSLRLKEYGLIPDFVPENYTSDYLVRELSESENLDGMNILRVKGYFDMDPLTDGFREKGANVFTCGVYKLEQEMPGEESINYLKQSGAEAVIFTSGSTVNNFFEILGEEFAANLFKTAKAVSIGPVTAKVLKQRKITNLAVAEKYNLNGIMDILKKVL